jgi:hypothetical protein
MSTTKGDARVRLGAFLDVRSDLRTQFLKELVVAQSQQGHVFRQVKLGDQYVALVGAPLPQESGEAIRCARVIHPDRSMTDAILVPCIKLSAGKVVPAPGVLTTKLAASWAAGMRAASQSWPSGAQP